MPKFYLFSKCEILGSEGEVYTASDHETMVERTVKAVQDHMFDWATVNEGDPGGFPKKGGRQTFIMPIPKGPNEQG